MDNRVAKPAARFIGAFLLVMALLGLINNPLIGQDGMIAADTPMIIAYALAGAALLGTSFSGESTCAFALYAVAAFSALLGSYALYMMGSYNNVKILDLLVASRSGSYFEIAIALICATCGKMNTASQQLFHE